jgi:hypothetical protein
MLELPQIGETILSAEAALTDPGERTGQSTLLEVHPRRDCRDGTELRHRGSDVPAPGLIKQVKRSVPGTLGLLEPGLRQILAVRPVHERSLRAQLSALLQVMSGGFPIT